MTNTIKSPDIVSDLSPAQYNPRKISQKRHDQLKKSMSKFGDLSGITYNIRTGRLVGGHQRIKQIPSDAKIAKKPLNDAVGTVALGTITTRETSWLYREVDWDEDTEKAANAAGGEFDNELLEKMVADLKNKGYDTDLLSLDNLDQMLDDLTVINEDDVPSVGKEATTKEGDIWKLGEHRLICGDSTMSRVVERLMNGAKASLCWTDPPYGVEYVGKTKDKLEIKNDGADGLFDLLNNSFISADKEALNEGSPIYICHPGAAQGLVFGDAIRSVGWRLHETLIWLKDSMVLGHSDYHLKHEPIYLCYKPGDGRFGRGGNNWYGSNSETSVLEFSRPKKSEEHPTMKPIDLVAHCIKNSSKRGDIVYDPFLGSGTTLIACEKMGRTCYGIEIYPTFCDVIIKRWENLTGSKAILLTGEKQNAI